MVTTAAIRFDREWAMPSAHTFTIPPIKRLLMQEGAYSGGIWADPFSGFNSPAAATNDLNPETPAVDHMDALEWLRCCETEFFDGALYDPPYSISQAAQVYAGFGVERLGQHPSNMGYWASIKDELARIVKPAGKVISCGWSTNGLGEGRGFVMMRILLVPHGGSKNDTIVTVETKQQARLL